MPKYLPSRYLPVIRRGGGSYSSKVLGTASANLIAYWKLNETTGTTANDSSGNARHGTISGATLGVSGIGDGLTAMSFDGVNDVVYNISEIVPLSSSTIMLWIRAVDARYMDVIGGIHNGTNYLQCYVGAGAISLVVVHGGVVTTCSAPITAGVWHCIAIRIDGSGSVDVCIDGIVVASQSYGGGATSESTPFYIASGVGVGYFCGSMAHAAIFNTVLSMPKIASLAVV